MTDWGLGGVGTGEAALAGGRLAVWLPSAAEAFGLVRGLRLLALDADAAAERTCGVECSLLLESSSDEATVAALRPEAFR